MPTVRSKRRAYLSSFDNRIRGYTGTLAEIAQIAKEYRVYYQKVPTGDCGYTMDHSAVIYLMGPDGKLATVIPYQEDDASAIAKLKLRRGQKISARLPRRSLVVHWRTFATLSAQKQTFGGASGGSSRGVLTR